MKLPANPWIILFIALVLYALIFWVAKVFKVDTRWMIADVPVCEYRSSDKQNT